MDDPELIAVLRRMANVCVIVRKQSVKKYADPKTRPLLDLARDGGLAHSAYPELAEYASREWGTLLVVGPGTPDWTEETQIQGVREVGFRESGGVMVPVVHAKIALLGQMCWTDEHPSGHVVDELWFEPERLWIGSANFTSSSRRGLEMGVWIDDHDLMRAARTFLLSLVTLSEPLGGGPDVIDPEMLRVEYDDASISEYMRERHGWDGALDEYDG